MQSADSISWPPEFSELKRLDVILKCGICYDFMNTCMITSCSHTYCSLCIRKFMQYKNQCPTCYEETFEINLRNNRLLDEVINIYTKIRDKLLRASRLASVNVPVKYESKESKSETRDLPVSNSTNSARSSTEATVEGADNDNTTKTVDPQAANSEQIKSLLKLPLKNSDSVVVNGVKVPGMFTSPKMSCARPRKPEELTSCPVCEVKIPARNINIHLDSCLALDPAAKPKPKVRKRSPLPKRVYTMMPEKNLKKFLKDYGLCTTGDRKALIGRLQRYTVIYNAENDAINPRSVTELIKQLEREEREVKKPNSIMKNLQTTTSRPNVPKNDVEAIEKANKAYCEENKSSFMKLIEEMRAREGRNIKPLKPTNRIYSDDEDDPNKVVSSTHDEAVPTTSGGFSGWPSSKESNSSPDETGAKNEVKENLANDNSDDDSDSDIIMNSDSEDKTSFGKIDWNKTTLDTNSEATPESVYDVATQKVVDLTSDNDSNDNEKLVEKNNISDVYNDEKSCESLSTDYGDSDSSIFDTSVKISSTKNDTKQKLTKLNRAPKRGRRRLSLGWKETRKKTKSNLEELPLKETSNEDDANSDTSDKVANIDDIIDGNHIDINMQEKMIDKDNTIDKESREINDITELNYDEINDNDGDFTDKSRNNEIIAEASVLNDTTATGVEESPEQEAQSIEETPMRRFTRSAKRKSISNQGMRCEEQELNTTPISRKKTKRDDGPLAFD